MCLPLARFRVVDRSMEPQFKEGDFVLVNRWAYLFLKPKIGEVVILIDPENTDRWLLKRITGANRTSYEVRGDNTPLSRDSRKFGEIVKRKIVGKVLLRIH